MPARMRQHEKIHNSQVVIGRRLKGNKDRLLDRDRLIVKVEMEGANKGRLGVYLKEENNLHITHYAEGPDNFHLKLPEHQRLVIPNARTSPEMQDAIHVTNIGKPPKHVPPRVIYDMLKDMFAIANNLRAQKIIHTNQFEFDPIPLQGNFDNRLLENRQLVVEITNGKYKGYIGVYSHNRRHLDITHKPVNVEGFHEVSTGPGGAFGPVIGGDEFVNPLLIGARIIKNIRPSSAP